MRLLHLPAHTTPAADATPVRPHSIASHSRAEQLPMWSWCGYCTCPRTHTSRRAATAPACTRQPPTRLSHSIDSHSQAEQLLMWSWCGYCTCPHTPAADATPVRPLDVAFDCLALTSRAAADVELVRLLHLLASTHQPPMRPQCGGWLSHSIASHSRAAADVKLVRLLHLPAHTIREAADVRRLHSIASHSRAEQLPMWS